MISTIYRNTETQYGDTMQRIALRELGDAKRWVEIVRLNKLRPPYLVDAAEDVRPGVLRTGSRILLPVEQGSTAENGRDAYLDDVALTAGVLSVENGDLAIVSGVDNLSQALSHRIRVMKRELLMHEDYGCWVRSLLGQGARPGNARLAEFYVRSSLLEDPRVAAVDSIKAEVVGDRISVLATATPIAGRAVTVSTVL